MHTLQAADLPAAVLNEHASCINGHACTVGVLERGLAGNTVYEISSLGQYVEPTQGRSPYGVCCGEGACKAVDGCYAVYYENLSRMQGLDGIGMERRLGISLHAVFSLGPVLVYIHMP